MPPLKVGASPQKLQQKPHHRCTFGDPMLRHSRALASGNRCAIAVIAFATSEEWARLTWRCTSWLSGSSRAALAAAPRRSFVQAPLLFHFASIGIIALPSRELLGGRCGRERRLAGHGGGLVRQRGRRAGTPTSGRSGTMTIAG